MFLGRTLQHVRYLNTVLNSAQSSDSIQVANIDGVSAIKIVDDEYEMATYIYCSDGWINELYIGLDDEPDLLGGQKIVKAESFKFSKVDKLIKGEISVGNGNTQNFVYSIKGGTK
ncbi:MAG: DUF4860 domain-containing protein [Clostridia bacterium]|nr:DUF4860 domain-containing protein [Clostridia bacterium]